jgi:hypothetical protein
MPPAKYSKTSHTVIPRTLDARLADADAGHDDDPIFKLHAASVLPAPPGCKTKRRRIAW